MNAMRLVAVGVIFCFVGAGARAEDKTEYAKLIVGKWEATKADDVTQVFVNEPTVAATGRSVDLDARVAHLEARVAAFVMSFAGGQEGGTAIAEVLSGQIEPSGRLSISVPRSAGAAPVFYNHKLKSAGAPIASGRRARGGCARSARTSGPAGKVSCCARFIPKPNRC